MAVQASVVHEDDYSLLKDLKLEIKREEATFSLCFWIYLLSSTSVPTTIIRQSQTGIEGDIPFLALNKEKKMSLFPLLFVHEEAPLPGDSTSWTEVPCASSEIECPLEKWVHVGCEVSANLMRLCIDGVVVGEKPLSSALMTDSNQEDLRITLAGAEGDNGRPHSFVHYVQILPLTSSINDHFVKNPPVELSIDSSCISEIEEGGDGIWSIVGGKASCRRNFTLDVVLLDAFGHPVNKEMEVVAALLYADNGAPVEKPNDAEAPLLTSYDGIEFSSSLRPSKLLHGRASFKLKISQLSSKCDNRLFRVRFDSPKTGRYPFLEAYSRPIRCISRSRNTRTSALLWKKSTTTANLIDGPQSLGVDDGSSEAQHNNCDEHFPILTAREPRSSPPSKRIKLGGEKSSVRVQADPTLDCPDKICNSQALNANQVNFTGSPVTKGGNAFGVGVEGKPENLEGMDNTPSDSESVQARDSAYKKGASNGNPVSDLIIFKYCLGSINEQSLQLKEVATSATDQEMTTFAQKVSIYTGCSHHRFQISIAKRLLKEGIDAWDSISQSSNQVLWEKAVIEIGDRFMKISRCNTRGLTEKDFELLRRISGCRDYMTQESFNKMWHWLYPVALALSTDCMNSMWGCLSPKWIEGLITKEEAESSLRGSRGLQEPGTFILRFPTSRSWPHPDAGSLIVTYVGADYAVHRRLLSLDHSNGEMNRKPLQDLLLTEPHLTRLGRVTRDACKFT